MHHAARHLPHIRSSSAVSSIFLLKILTSRGCQCQSAEQRTAATTGASTRKPIGTNCRKAAARAGTAPSKCPRHMREMPALPYLGYGRRFQADYCSLWLCSKALCPKATNRDSDCRNVMGPGHNAQQWPHAYGPTNHKIEQTMTEQVHPRPIAALCVFSLALLLALQASAQETPPTDDNPTQVIEAEVAVPEAAAPPLTPAQELALEAEAAVQAEQAAAVTSGRQRAAPLRSAPVVQMLTVRSVTAGPSAYLDEAEVSAAISAMIGQSLPVAQAGQLTAGFNALYQQKGIGLASATVASVDPRSGDVRIMFNEPGIGAVRVTDGALASGDVYARRLGLPQGALADTRLIAARQLRLQRLSGVTLELTDTEAENDDTLALVFTPSEPPPRSFSVVLDNHGSRATGRERVTLTFAETSLTGQLDPLSASLTLARGVRSVALGYARPLTPDGLSLFTSASLERTRTIRGVAQTSRSSNVELGLSWPVLVEAERQLVLRGSVQRFRETRDTFGARTTDQRGTVLALGATGTLIFERGVLSYDQSLRHIRWSDAIFTGGRTTILSGEGSFVRALTDDWQGFARLGWQTVQGRASPAAFRSTLSSPSRVRGYDDPVSAGDGFYFLSAQIQRATPWTISEDMGLQAFPFAFVDMGRAYDRAGGSWTAQDTLLSVGIGSALQLGDRVFGELVLATPLRNANGFTARGKLRADLRIGARF